MQQLSSYGLSGNVAALFCTPSASLEVATLDQTAAAASFLLPDLACSLARKYTDLIFPILCLICLVLLGCFAAPQASPRPWCRCPLTTSKWCWQRTAAASTGSTRHMLPSRGVSPTFPACLAVACRRQAPITRGSAHSLFQGGFGREQQRQARTTQGSSGSLCYAKLSH